MTTHWYVKRRIAITATRMTEPFVVQTLEGSIRGKAGDYLVTGIHGEQYPVDATIFEQSYELYNPDRAGGGAGCQSPTGAGGKESQDG